MKATFTKNTLFYLFFFFPFFLSHKLAAQCFSWGLEGAAAFSSGHVQYTSVTTDAAGTPYVVYMDEDQGFKATAKKFTGGAWTTIGTAGFTPGRADYTSIAVNSGGTPYVAFMDNTVFSKITVMRFNGTSWVTVGPAGFSAGQAEYVNMAIDASGTPYVAYTDWGNVRRVTVMKYNGTAWVAVGLAGFTAGQTNYTRMAFNSAGLPYVAYKDQSNGDKASVMRYDGFNWVVVGTVGLSAGVADYTAITLANDTPFVAYSDVSLGGRATAKKFNGTAWVAAGTAGFTPGQAAYINMATDASGNPHMSYVDVANSRKTTVQKYAAGAWSAVGTANFSAGGASHSAMAITAGNKIYVAYADSAASAKATVMKYDNGTGPITGTLKICVGNNTTLGNFASGGSWSSSNTGVASVGAATGIVTGNAAGTATISYAVTAPCGAVTVTATVTVNPYAGAITGALSVCSGATTTLASTTTGGTWTSSNTAAGTVPAGSGVVTGIAAGTTTISYWSATTCGVSAVVTVSTTPAAITGPLTVCSGASVTLSSSPTGGTWTSGNTTVATAVPATGVISGSTAGTSVMSYTMPGGCYRTAVLTVNASPSAITGTLQVCASGSTPLGNAVPGGAWTSSNISVASVVSSTGMVIGVAPGTSVISYFLTGGCYSTAVVTVNIQPASISGAAAVCVGGTTALSCTPAGGTWASNNTSLATVSGTGMVSGVAFGSPTITYALANGCFRTLLLSVSAAPGAITGTLSACEGTTTTLACYPPGGTWSSSNTNSSVGASSGIVTGNTAGTSVITYTTTLGCIQTATVTIGASPSVITGLTNVCTGSGITLSSSAGGTWSSGSIGTATVGASTGIVTGVAPGTVVIYYTIPSGCYRTHTVTVNATPAPAALVGPSSICVGASTTFFASVAGGVWSIVTGKASVSTSGVVTGVAGGADTIVYSMPSVCGLIDSRQPLTVTPLPDAGTIIGPTDVCIGQTISLSSTMPGGTWKSSNVVFAVVSTAGVVTGIVAGPVIISYRATNACGSDTAYASVLVHELPVVANIVAPNDSVCQTDTLRLTNPTPGGTWSSVDAAVATVDAGGLVTGLTFGPVTIRYILTDMCGSDTASVSLYVVPSQYCPTSVRALPSLQFGLWPNPTTGQVSITSPVGGDLLLYTVDGRLVGSYRITTGTTAITLPRNLAAGIYVSRFMGNNGSQAMTRIIYAP